MLECPMQNPNLEMFETVVAQSSTRHKLQFILHQNFLCTITYYVN